MIIDMSNAARNWLENQEVKEFKIKHLDVGRNEFVQSQEAWDLFLSTFVFTDRTPLLEVLYIHFMGIGDG
jgi:hypothetical protein